MKCKLIKTKAILITALMVLCFSGCDQSTAPENNNTNPVNPPEGFWTGTDVNPKVGNRETSLNAIFDNSTLGETVLTFTEAEWNKLLQYYDQNPKNEESVYANYAYKKGDSVWRLNNIGVRIRGNTSRRRPEGATGGRTAVRIPPTTTPISRSILRNGSMTMMITKCPEP
ncbi:hypothetical protein K7I13_13055 [Brucepastera parasyntrophica]|uniref:hypothetical protein n=1 Tax=Brucepastera parasyntrophica TaxID=2880008 RepID=UPI00210DFC2F|nr:hypothetical protein [Brucepastera parasyntrophica]ULQ59392.1 hypothetical protein K7I13_13055 [Brucepastera parasyntrophica]